MNRKTLLGGALGATLLAAALVDAPGDSPDVAAAVAAVPKPRDLATRAPPPAASAPRPADRRAWAEPRPEDLAAWMPPPPPAPPPAPPPPPAAAPAPPPIPAFPYQWIGLLDDGATVHVLLANEQRSLGAKEGDVLDSQWRIERIAERRLDLTWIPTGETVVLSAR